jgi:hypothetical protein
MKKRSWDESAYDAELRLKTKPEIFLPIAEY